MEIERKLRKSQNALVVTGEGTMIFGFWGVLKTIMIAIIFRRDFFKSFEDVAVDIKDPHLVALIGVIITYILLFLIIGIDLRIRCYIGLSAVREGMGNPQKTGYVVAAGLLSLFYLLCLVLEIFSVIEYGKTGSYEDTIASIIVDLTSTITVIYLFINAVRVKMIVKQWILR